MNYCAGVRLCLLVFIAGFAWNGGAKAQSSASANTPRPITLYYNQAMELTSPEKALYRRETMLDFENITFSGICKDYTQNDNKLTTEAFYDHGVNSGLHTEYDEKGKIRSTLEYSEEGFIIWELRNEKDSLIVTHGNGKFSLACFAVEALQNGSVTLKQGLVKGEFQRGKRVGTWIYEGKNFVKTDEEIYDQGVFVKRNSFASGSVFPEQTKKNIIISLEDILAETFQYDAEVFANLQGFFAKYGPALPTSYNRAITFPGGMKKLLLIIAAGLPVQIDENVVVKLTIDENGNFEKIRANFLLGANFGDQLTQLVKPHAGKILPAIVNGKPVASTIRIPVGTSKEWITYLQTVPDDDVNGLLDELNAEK